MTNLLFIRHAETDMAGTFCGHSDPPINERGQKQLSRLIAELHTELIEEIISSDLKRARMTANAIAMSFQVPISFTSKLREIHFGDWEGLSWSAIEHRDPAYARLWTEQYPKCTAPGGESFSKFRARILDEITALIKHGNHKSAAVVTHAGVMRVILSDLCGLDEQDAWNRTSQYCCSFLYVPTVGLREVNT